MKVVVDTNIVFSALLNSTGTIGALLFDAGRLKFYSCTYMQQEIKRHWPKLRKISRLSEVELQAAYEKLLLRIRFIHEGLIPTAIWVRAEELVRDIDPDDIAFVALTQYLEGALWTGDKVLHDGLKGRQFSNVYLTADLPAYRVQPPAYAALPYGTLIAFTRREWALKYPSTPPVKFDLGLAGVVLGAALVVRMRLRVRKYS